MEESQQGPKNKFQNYAKYSAMIFQMGIIIFAGSYLGVWLDKHYGMKTPVFTASLALLSVFAAIYFAIKDFIRKK